MTTTTPGTTRRKPGRPKLTNPRTPLNTAVSRQTHEELRSLAENTGMALNRLVEVAIHALWVNNQD